MLADAHRHALKQALRKVGRAARPVLPRAYWKSYRVWIERAVGPTGFWGEPVVFIHIPKTGGTSVHSTGVYRSYGHMPASHDDRAWIDEQDLPPLFAVVRHPYSRFASAYYFLRAGGNSAYDRYYARKLGIHRLGLNEFAARKVASGEALDWLHFKPQADFLTNRSGELSVRFLLRFEHLENDWRRFATGFDLPPVLERRNVGRSRKKAPLTEESKLIIRRAYHRDFELLGFRP